MQAVLFDLDGTLADSLRDIAEALNHALALHGLPTLSLARVRESVGAGTAVLVRLAAAGQSPARYDSLLAELRRYYLAHPHVHTRAYPGVAGLLAALVQRSLRLGVLSNKPHDLTCAIVAELFPTIPFGAVVGQRAGQPLKPDPGSALAMASELGVAPAECLFVGDSGIDMQTACAAGMLPVGVLWGFRDRSELCAAGARILLERPAELLEQLDGAAALA